MGCESISNSSDRTFYSIRATKKPYTIYVNMCLHHKSWGGQTWHIFHTRKGHKKVNGEKNLQQFQHIIICLYIKTGKPVYAALSLSLSLAALFSIKIRAFEFQWISILFAPPRALRFLLSAPHLHIASIIFFRLLLWLTFLFEKSVWKLFHAKK